MDSQTRRGERHVLQQRGAGLDIQTKTGVACVLLTASDGQVQQPIRTFSTLTAALLALANWLETLAITQSALECTGVYWHPVWNV